MIYLIPKNIKVKREIFKGFGIIEILAIALAFGIGFLLQNLTNQFQLKVLLFSSLPLLTFILLFPLPNGSTALIIFKKCIIYNYNQKKYKFK